jgi:hypothetical protein
LPRIGQDAGVLRALVVVVAAVVVGACGSTGSTTVTGVGTVHCDSAAVLGAQSPSLPALVRLAARDGAPLHGALVNSGHGHAGPSPPVDVSPATARTLAAQLRAAALVACRLRTTDDAQRAGYVRSANFDQGTGTHWTNWRLVDAPFDPARPSMLLYGPRLGETRLYGFSYWLRTTSTSGPVGFAGGDDHWHRHYGLCFDRDGILQKENLRSARLCAGTYVNGQDIWMLHAWVVPGLPNVWGLFAELNPQLCNRNVADIARCAEPGEP